MAKHYFIESLHYAGMGDICLPILIEILQNNPAWVNQFSPNGANPILISVESGHLKTTEYILNNLELAPVINEKLLISCLLIENQDCQHEMFKILLEFPFVKKDIIFPDGTCLFNKLIIGSSKNISLIQKHNIICTKESLYGKNVLFDLIDCFTIDKTQNIEYLLSHYSLNELLDISYQGKNLIDYIYLSSLEDTSRQHILDIINAHAQKIQEDPLI